MSWHKVELQEFCKTGSGTTPSRDKPDYYGGTIPWVKSGELRESVILKTEEHVTDLALAQTSLKLAPAGALLVAMYGATVGRVGQLGIDATTNQAVCHVIPDPKRADARYMFHMLQANSAFLIGQAVGGAQPNISQGVIKSLKIPLPPLEEQKRIAGILDQADALRRMRARALEKLNTLGQTVFQEMFGDPQRNLKGWETQRLDDMGTLDRGVSKHRPRNDPALLGGKHPLIQTGDVSKANDYITEYRSTYSDLGLKQSKLWRKGTVCITIAANIADTAILDFDACFPDSVVGFDSGVPSKNFFIHRWFETIKGHLDAIAPAVAQKNINLGILRELPVICPPDALIEDFYQQEIAIRHQASAATMAMTKQNELFSSLQSAAFQGKL